MRDCVELGVVEAGGSSKNEEVSARSTEVASEDFAAEDEAWDGFRLDGI